MCGSCVPQVLEREAALLGGGEKGRASVMLGGASQGGLLAIHAALTYPAKLGGVISLRSAAAEAVTPLPEAGGAAAGGLTPIFVFAGDRQGHTPQGTTHAVRLLPHC